MGLDMYLFRKKKGEPDNTEEVMYWRKANQIRGWLVDNIEEFNEDDNCKMIPVTKELLEMLVEDCKTVLEDHTMAEELLSVTSGFFFGPTQYDDWYFGVLQETVDGLIKVISETDWETEEVSYYEWW